MSVKKKKSLQEYLLTKFEGIVSFAVSKVLSGRYVARFKSGYMTIFDKRWESRLLYSSAWNRQAQQMLCFFIPWVWLFSPFLFVFAFAYAATFAVMGMAAVEAEGPSDGVLGDLYDYITKFPDRRMMVLGFAIRLIATVLFIGLAANFLGFISGVVVSKTVLFRLGLCSRLLCMRYPRYIRDKYIGVTGVAALSFHAFVYRFPLLISPVFSAAIVSLFFCATVLRIENFVDASHGRARVHKEGAFLSVFLFLYASTVYGVGLWSSVSLFAAVYAFEKVRGSRQNRVSDFFNYVNNTVAVAGEDSSLEDICSRSQHNISVEEVWQFLVNKKRVVFGSYTRYGDISVENLNALFPKVIDCLSELYELDCMGVNRFIRMLLRSQHYSVGSSHDTTEFTRKLACFIGTESMVFERWVELLVGTQIDGSSQRVVKTEQSAVLHPEYESVYTKFRDLEERKGGDVTFFSMDDRSQSIVVYQMLSYWRLGFTSRVDSSLHSLLVRFAADILSKPVCQYPKWQVFLSAGLFKSRWWSNIGTGVSLGFLGRRSVDNGYSKNEKLLGGLRGIAARFLAGCNLSSADCVQTVPASFSHVNSPHVLVDLLFLHSQNKLALDLDVAQVDAFMSVFSSTLDYTDEYPRARKGFYAWFQLFSGFKLYDDADGMFSASVSRIATALKCFSGKVSLVGDGSPSAVKRLEQCEKICSNFVSMIGSWQTRSDKQSISNLYCDASVRGFLEILKLWKDDAKLSSIFITVLCSYTRGFFYVGFTENMSATQDEVKGFFDSMPDSAKTQSEWSHVKREFSGSFWDGAAGRGNSSRSGYSSRNSYSSGNQSSSQGTEPTTPMDWVNSYNRLIDEHVQEPGKKAGCKLPTVLREVTEAVVKKKKKLMSLLLHPDKVRITVPEGYTPEQASSFKAREMEKEKARRTEAFKAVNGALEGLKESFGYS